MKGTRVHVNNRYILAIGLALLLMLLAACGANATGTTTPGSGTSTPPVSATNTPAKPLATQHCGVVHTLRLQVVPADKSHADGVENCFWQAYQKCNPATLVYSQGNLDTVVLHNFSLKSQNGQCVITDAVQRSVVPRPPQTVGNYTCSNLLRQRDGLSFATCGSEGNVLVPSVGVE